jgi:hypothetical protein
LRSHPESSLGLLFLVGRFAPPFCPCGVLMSPNYGRIQVVDLPVHLSLGVFMPLKRLQYAIPYPTLPPTIEATGHGPPRTISAWEIAPGSSGAIYPEDAIYDAPMIGIRAAPMGLLRGQVWFQTFPLAVGQICSYHPNSVPA